jgi:hypothetical protein
MPMDNDAWWKRPELWVEAFVILNLGFLTFDIYLAHSENQFRSRAEYIPLFFSAIAPVVLILALIERRRNRLASKLLGHLVGWTAIVVGCTGVIFHLESHFFYERTIRSLTYSAPFAAPLAYTGLGFLLVMNRMVEVHSIEWSRWVLLFTLGGFFGDFIFSLVDHAGNGFFFRAEWVPVAASALASDFFLCRWSSAFRSSFLISARWFSSSKPRWAFGDSGSTPGQTSPIGSRLRQLHLRGASLGAFVVPKPCAAGFYRPVVFTGP